mmetsp:Transcript_31673/g.63207  ORF Transcript_31673/g.63207 Transcript_31673/m.63207 type:complete len:488 (+) Transcript_31673:51-1514(+)
MMWLHGSVRAAVKAPARKSQFFSAGAAPRRMAPPQDVDITALLDDIGDALTPINTVEKLDQHIVGQAAAKKAVAIAMRNRWRRQQLPDYIKNEIVPKNILMVGPTGCGKTEIARRISKMTQAPFIKVEATKFTEVGFHGKDVDSIIKDLVDTSLTMTRKHEADRLRGQAEKAVEDRLIAVLLGLGSSSEASFRELLRNGALEERKIEIELKPSGADKGKGAGGDTTVVSSGNISELMGKFQEMAKKESKGGGGGKRSMSVREARPLIEEEELERLMEAVDVTKAALKAVEESGIVFIDEIDKICVPSGKYRGADASAEGVQRDLLPLIEGCVINTKHGDVKTDYILFIASGAFHTCKPSDLLAELQGRLPIAVTLDGLSEDDMYRILTEPATNLIAQQVELMATEGVKLVVEDGAIRELASVASRANNLLENIGARRLHTIVERVMESMSFEAPDMPLGSEVVVTKDMVTEKISSMLTEKDLSKFIL